MKDKNNKIFVVLIVASIITTILATALSSAIPAIMTEFNISANMAQWVTSLYSLSSGVLIIATAFILKRFPTKKLFLFGMGLFLIGVFLCAIANGLWVLLIGRVMQGIGNGLILALTQVVILKIFPMEKRGFAMGIYGLAVGFTPVVAPVLAGILIDFGGWRLIFYSVLVLCLVNFGMACAWMWDVLENEECTFDMISMVYATLGFGGIILGLGNIGSYPVISVQIGVPIIVGMIAILLFVKRQLRGYKPLLEMRVLKQRNFTISVIISIILYALLNGATIVLPIYMQSVMGKSATVYGLCMMPSAMLIGLLSPITGKIYDRYGVKWLAVFGGITMLISNLGMITASETTSIWYIIILMCIKGLGIAAVMMPIMTWGISGVKANYVTDCTAIMNCLRTIGGALGVALFVALMSINGETDSAINVTVSGVRFTFICMSVLSVLQLLFSLMIFKHKKV